ncbi:MAG: hypothetical protein AAF581_10235 [Planctomycetota bacterium]
MLFLLRHTTYVSHGSFSGLSLLRLKWVQALEGDEELLGLLACMFFTLAVAHALVALLLRAPVGVRLLVLCALVVGTAACAGLESAWYPGSALGNCIAGAVCATVFGIVYARFLRSLVSGADA